MVDASPGLMLPPVFVFHLLSSPQVAGLSTRFRFGPPEDLLAQTSASHSDLGQLASQGGTTHIHSKPWTTVISAVLCMTLNCML